MKRILLRLVLIVLVVGIAMVACAKPAPSPTPTPAPAPPKTLDIGIVTPLTGPAASLGTNMQNAILLAIDDQNNQGGVTIAGQKHMLNGIIRDSKLDLVVAKSVAEELIFDKGVKFIGGTFQFDAIGAQSVTEKNKVILFSINAAPGLCTPQKPYTFFPAGASPLALYIPGAAYIQKFYPEAKTVVTMTTDLPSLPVWVDAAKTVCPLYGFNWLGSEKFPITTKDFMPVISRTLAMKSDIIDIGGTGGDMGGTACLLLKQLREAGFNGIIWCPTVPPPSVMMEIVPEKSRTGIVTGDVVVDSPIVSQAFKDMYNRYVKKFGEPPLDIVGEMYNGVKPFFESLNGQDTTDSTAWMEVLAKLHWQGYFGHEAFWVGKPTYGIARLALRPFYVSEWTNGKIETKWEAPIPWDLFVEKK